MIFDGKSFAAKIEADLEAKIAKLNRPLKLAIWLDPSNASGAKYVQKKIEMAQRLGVEVVLNKVTGDEDGVMVQMPHPNSQVLIDQIDLNKDVDGLKDNSPFVPATVRAVLEILGYASLHTTPLTPSYIGGGGPQDGGGILGTGKVLVIGSKGFVGRKLFYELSTMNYQLIGMDKENFDPEKLKTADVIISATGQPSLITPEMVKEGVVAIDVGFPKGDFDPSTALRASFFTPVPGGVGPVTIVMMFANLQQTRYSKFSYVRFGFGSSQSK